MKIDWVGKLDAGKFPTWIGDIGMDWISKIDWGQDALESKFIGPPKHPDIFVGVRRVSATGAIFKRELKTNDTFQGSSIVDTGVAPNMPDI